MLFRDCLERTIDRGLGDAVHQLSSAVAAPTLHRPSKFLLSRLRELDSSSLNASRQCKVGYFPGRRDQFQTDGWPHNPLLGDISAPPAWLITPHQLNSKPSPINSSRRHRNTRPCCCADITGLTPTARRWCGEQEHMPIRPLCCVPLSCAPGLKKVAGLSESGFSVTELGEFGDIQCLLVGLSSEATVASRRPSGITGKTRANLKSATSQAVAIGWALAVLV